MDIFLGLDLLIAFGAIIDQSLLDDGSIGAFSQGGILTEDQLSQVVLRCLCQHRQGVPVVLVTQAHALV